MPSIDKFFWMNLLCSLFFFNLTQLWATEKVAKRTDHAQAVGAIIVNCEKKAMSETLQIQPPAVLRGQGCRQSKLFKTQSR